MRRQLDFRPHCRAADRLFAAFGAPLYPTGLAHFKEEGSPGLGGSPLRCRTPGSAEGAVMLELNFALKLSDRCMTAARIRMESGFLLTIIAVCLRFVHKA